MLAGRRTIAPMEERAAAAFKLREAPTHAQVSSRDRGASRGLSLLTKPGRKVLHTRPARNSSSLETPHHPLQYCSVDFPQNFRNSKSSLGAQSVARAFLNLRLQKEQSRNCSVLAHCT